jgi:hypothetical protein
MGPPDVDMTAGAPNKKTKQQRAPMEEENRARENATKDLTFKLAYLKTRSSPNDPIMQREPSEFAKEWASEIWKRAMQNPDATIRDYNDEVYSVLQDLDEMDKQWDKAKVAEDGKEWTGQALFVFQIDKLHFDMLPITFRSESIDNSSSDTSSNDGQAQPVADSDSRNPATRVTETDSMQVNLMRMCRWRRYCVGATAEASDNISRKSARFLNPRIRCRTLTLSRFQLLGRLDSGSRRPDKVTECLHTMTALRRQTKTLRSGRPIGNQLNATIQEREPAVNSSSIIFNSFTPVNFSTPHGRGR